LIEGSDFLTREQRTGYTQEIDDGCRNDLQKATADFCAGILTERLESPEPGFKFESLEARLPKPDQVVVKDRAHEWTRALLPMLDARKPEALLQAAADAAAFDEAGDNPWFRAAELAAYQALMNELRNQTAKARGGSRDLVEQCRKAAEPLAAAWDKMLADLPQQFRKRNLVLENHAKAVAAARYDFPGDPEYLKTLDLADVLNKPNAEHRLAEADQKLRELHGVGNLTRESQHSLLVNLVTARALSGAFQGATAAEIAASLKEFAKPLKDAGVGGEERSRFGPKVAAVFDRLLQ
jgi:hypothetical protein